MIRMLIAAAVLMVAQSQPQGEAPASADNAAEVRNCIDLSRATTRRAVDERTILFESVGGKNYRNRLAGRCPGLRDASRGFGTLAFDVYGSQICRGDRVRVLNPSSARGLGDYQSAIPCPLGEFILEPEQPDRAAH